MSLGGVKRDRRVIKLCKDFVRRSVHFDTQFLRDLLSALGECGEQDQLH